MIIAVPKETLSGETRVALTPDVVKRLTGQKLTLRIEKDAGAAASYPDAAYQAVGAEIVADREALWRDADMVIKIHRPLDDGGHKETALLREGLILIATMQPLINHALVRELADRKVTSFSMDVVPRTTRAQSMDVLSSMSTVAGYKAVLLAAAQQGRFFPMLVTAAGTIAPAQVLVLGAGVAGLQAIATAKRLGAVVSAFDVRPVVKEQVESLGAKFIATEIDEAGVGEGGYAKELAKDQQQRNLELIHKHIKKMDVVISTALIPGKPAPTLITDDMLKDMPEGAVVVDLAAEAGGNCTATRAGETLEAHGVTVMGPVNLPASMAFHASQMYAKNMNNFLALLVKDGALNLNFEDDIVAGTCVTHEGKVIHEATRKGMEGGNN